MPLYPDLHSDRDEVVSSSLGEMANYTSVGDALKLVPYFSGDKKDLLSFLENVETAVEVVNPEHRHKLFKFILTRINGEPRAAIKHRHLDTWDDVKVYLENTYTEKRTLDYYAKVLFVARQRKDETVTQWIQKIQNMGSEFRDSAMQDSSAEEAAGILKLSDRIRNICFVQGLYSDRIQTIVKSRNPGNFDDCAQLALEEESAIVSRFETRSDRPDKCGNCGRMGHSTAKCYLKQKKEMKVNHVANDSNERKYAYDRSRRPSDITCYNCGLKGHMSRECRKPRKNNGTTVKNVNGAWSDDVEENPLTGNE